jgi:hypothetical protein
MRSLNFTWACRGRTAIALPGADMASADAPAVEETPLPGAELCARRSHADAARGIASRPDAALPPAIVSAPTRAPPYTRRREGRITLSPHKAVLDSSQASSCGPKARERRRSGCVGMEVAKGRAQCGSGRTSRATSRRALGGTARCRGERSASLGSRVDPTFASAVCNAGRSSNFTVLPRAYVRASAGCVFSTLTTGVCVG